MANLGTTGGKPVLITFPPSLDSEFARFLLHHYDVDHTEERHTLFVIFAVTRWRGGKVNFPMLLNDRYTLASVRDMIYYFEARATAGRRLLPEGEAERAELARLWPQFYAEFGAATTLWVYYYVVPHKEILAGPLAEGAPRWEGTLVRLAYPVFANLLRKGLKLNRENADAALVEIRRTFDAIDQRLGDGRPFLLGAEFTLADLLFAVMAAPVLLPEGYGGAIPPLAAMPAEVRQLVEELRERKAGRFALRIYRDYRHRRP